MGLEFLVRIRRSSIGLGVVASLLGATYSGLAAGGAIGLGVAWSLVNFALLERLVVAITGPDRGTRPAVSRAAVAIAGMTLLFGAGGALLFLMPPLMLLLGFVVPFVVMVLKAASMLLLESRAWKAMVASKWRAAFVVVSVLVLAWWLVPTRVMAPARASGEQTEATSSAEGHGAETDAHATESAAAEHGGGEEDKGPQKFANVITVLVRAFPNAPWAHFLHEFEAPIFAIFIALLICLVAFLATRKAKLIPGPLQNVVEMLVGGLNDFIIGILGEKDGPRFVPFLGTLFIYIWAMNLFGLIPFMDSPTSNLNTTVALAIMVFLYVQWVGLRSLGPIGYVDHLMGSPRDAVSWFLVPLMLPIHVMGELAKPISLACRLFGNIFGEDMLLVAFASLGITVSAFFHLACRHSVPAAVHVPGAADRYAPGVGVHGSQHDLPPPHAAARRARTRRARAWGGGATAHAHS